MLLLTPLSFILYLLVQRVVAHGGVWNYSIAGEWQPGFFPYYPAKGQSSIQRHWVNFAPMHNLTNGELVCNTPGSYADKYAPIQAGTEIKAYWKAWPHTIGPVLVWMARCGDEPTSCSNFNGTGNHWFKIDQVGLVHGTILNGLWGQGVLRASNDTWNTTIPATLKQGAYLIRHEIIALHYPWKPEFYPECAHLYVTGNGTELPDDEYITSIPGVYSYDNPRLFMDVYKAPTSNLTEWQIPGPPVWKGSG